MFSNRWTAALLMAALFALPAWANDEDEKKESAVVRSMDLTRYRLPAAPRGPRVAVPTDIIAAGGDATDISIWDVERAFENGTWLPFEDAPLERGAISFDSVVELVSTSLEGQPALADKLDTSIEDLQIVFQGPAASVAAAAKSIPWILEGLAPSIRVDARLMTRGGREAERLVAMGSVRIWPQRWTRVYLQRNEIPCTPVWDIEVAQEATTMDPFPVPISEGQELYLRYHPGETTSLVEIWAGDVTHLEIIKQDLSRVRNIPEANGPGVVSYPKSAVNRVFAQIAVPTGKRVQREILWNNEGRRSRLRLDFSAPPAPHQPLDRGDRNALVMLRAGALANGLEFDARRETQDQWNERISGVLYAAAEAYQRRGRAFDFSVSALDGGSIFLVEAPAAELPKARTVIAQSERALRTKTADLRVVTVPEPVYRKALLEGGLQIGSEVHAETMKAFFEAGATNGESVSTPALLGTSVGFRVGHTVPGLVDFDPELAQQSAGLHPVTSVRFAGLFGDLRLRKTPRGHALRVRGAITWADREAGEIEITVRPPVSMRGAVGAALEVDKPGRKVALPILGGGVAPIESEIELPGESAGSRLLHAHVRGDEVVMLLVGIR